MVPTKRGIHYRSEPLHSGQSIAAICGRRCTETTCTTVRIRHRNLCDRLGQCNLCGFALHGDFSLEPWSSLCHIRSRLARRAMGTGQTLSLGGPVPSFDMEAVQPLGILACLGLLST